MQHKQSPVRINGTVKQKRLGVGVTERGLAAGDNIEQMFDQHGRLLQVCLHCPGNKVPDSHLAVQYSPFVFQKLLRQGTRLTGQRFHLLVEHGHLSLVV